MLILGLLFVEPENPYACVIDTKAEQGMQVFGKQFSLELIGCPNASKHIQHIK